MGTWGKSLVFTCQVGEEEISHVGPVQLFGGETEEFQNFFT